MGLEFELEKFTGSNDLKLWKMKMKALLVLRGLDEALKGENETVPADTSAAAAEKKTMRAKAHSAIILHLADRVLRRVARETTPHDLWKKLDELYMSKAPANRLRLKQALYSFTIQEGRPIEEQIDCFDKLVMDLENIEAPIAGEDQALLLLCALPRRYNHLKKMLLYGREEALKLEDVVSAINRRQGSRRNGSSAVVRGRSHKRDFKKPIKCSLMDMNQLEGSHW